MLIEARAFRVGIIQRKRLNTVAYDGIINQRPMRELMKMSTGLLFLAFFFMAAAVWMGIDLFGEGKSNVAPKPEHRQEITDDDWLYMYFTSGIGGGEDAVIDDED